MQTAPGLTERNTLRVLDALDQLWRYLPPAASGAWAVSGELAQYHYLHAGHRYTATEGRRDLELVIGPEVRNSKTGLFGLSSGYRRWFQLAHRHDGGATGVLVHLRTGVQIGLSVVRHNQPPVIEEFASSYIVPFQPVEHEIVSLLEALLGLKRGEFVDRALFGRMDGLMQLIHQNTGLRGRVDLAWESRHRGQGSFDERLAEAYGYHDRRSDLLRPPRRPSLFRSCPDCQSDGSRPPAPPWQVTYIKTVRSLRAPRAAPMTRL